MASPIDAWVIVVGIYRNEPSSRGGMNSLPRPSQLLAMFHWSRTLRGCSAMLRSGWSGSFHFIRWRRAMRYLYRSPHESLSTSEAVNVFP